MLPDSDTEQVNTQQSLIIKGMKEIKVTLSSGEITLTPDDIQKLKPIIDSALADLEDDLYAKLAAMKLKDAKPTLEQMTELQIIELMKEDAMQIKFRWYDITGLTKILLSELFKRNGLGYKSVDRLSGSQKSFLKNLNIYQF